jgi:hypothetical protein
MKCKESHRNNQFQQYKSQIAREGVLSEVLNSVAYRHLIDEYCWSFQENTLYNPLVTLEIFINQVLCEDKSCANAVSGVLAHELEKRGNIVGQGTGGYVKARQRLSEELIHELLKRIGIEQLEQTPAEWKPYGRHLKGFDGTTITMADTQANQEQFPKHSNQKKNVGFPLARLVVVLSLTLGTVIDYAVGPCKGKGSGEASLLRTLLPCIEPNDIVLGDRYYPHFFLLCDLKNKGVDGVFRAAAQRHYDFRRGKRLGKEDHIAMWQKPTKPDWMTSAEYKAYPNSLAIREFKNAGFIYVTTFLDPEIYTTKDLCLLYKRRWEVETHLNSIKTVMSMDRLTCKTPQMIIKEIGIHFLAYNIIKTLIIKAAAKHSLAPGQISFKRTIQLLHNFTPLFSNLMPEDKRDLFEILLDCISKNKVANRPGRIEPRAVKQRPKTFPVLKTTRKEAQSKLRSERYC